MNRPHRAVDKLQSFSAVQVFVAGWGAARFSPAFAGPRRSRTGHD